MLIRSQLCHIIYRSNDNEDLSYKVTFLIPFYEYKSLWLVGEYFKPILRKSQIGGAAYYSMQS